MGLNFYHYDGLQLEISGGLINEHECTSIYSIQLFDCVCFWIGIINLGSLPKCLIFLFFLGDEDDENDAAHDDPHKALGAINLDDLESIPAYVPIDTTKDQIGDMFGSSSGKKIQSQTTDDNAKSKKKKSKEKKEKKSKKSKKSKSDPDQLLVETDRVVQVNGSNNKTENAKAAEQAHDQTDDLEFWLSPSNQLPAAPSNVKKPQQAQEEPSSKSEEKSKKKHKKKSSKHDKHSEKQVNGIGNSDLAKLKSSPAPPALSLTLLASNSSLKLSYDVRRVPMEPEKMTVGVSFCNVGTTPISSVELDFLDNANVQVVHDSPNKGIKLEMDLEAGKVEDHLFLFQVSLEN